MAILPILCYPDPRLHTVALPVQQVDDRVRQLVSDMLEIDVSEERNAPLVLVNPEIVWYSPERHRGDEGCLSVPGIYDGVERADAVHVQALDAQGVLRTIEASDLLAVCVQHELDHLLGKVFVEYLSPLKRNRIKSKMLKRQREERE